jgi:signal transduction histidine kinase/ActR/RegA family two-component response regulator
MAHPHVRAMGATGQTLMGRRRDGTHFPIEIALSPIESEGAIRFLASIRDISDSPRARQMLVRARYDALVARFGQLALEAKEDEDVLAHVPLLLTETLGAQSVVIAFVSTDNERVEMRAAVGVGSTGGLHLNAQALLSAIRSGEAWMVEDLSLQPQGMAANILNASQGSATMLPLLDVNRPMGCLLAFCDRPDKFDHDALHLLQSFANLIAALVQRQRTQDQLAHVQRLDALGQLTGGIAHDFNNLLTIMSGNLQLLEGEVSANSEAGELIESALRSVARGSELTAKLLSFARRQRLVPQAVDLPEMLHDLTHMLKRTLGDKIRLRVNCPTDLPLAHADPTQLDTALVNLALNARDAMPRGGEILIEAKPWTRETSRADRESQNHLLITVSDTGRGMDPSTLAHAMEPFFTTKEAGRGSGLGLSMVHGFAKQSGGDLWIDSALGYGTHVHLCLPMDKEGLAARAHPAASTVKGSGETILVVEDEISVRRIAASFLTKAGYQVIEADGADRAIELLEQNERISLLFTDVLLGEGGNGKELAQRAYALRPHLPILLTSGFEQTPASQTFGTRETELELLRKPYRREQLLDAIGQCLASSRHISS